VIVSEVDAAACGALTQNVVQSWSVMHNRDRLTTGRARAIVCTSGNANACNGIEGKIADEGLADSAAFGLSVAPDLVLTASTGVIGRPFPLVGASHGIEAAIGLSQRSPGASLAAAKAIMTTDLVPKECAVQVETDRGTYRVGGIAKGSGMIAPNMATMFGFVTTDIEVLDEPLGMMWRSVVAKTFNCATVDGDTSTSDMALVLANGMSGVNANFGDVGLQEALQTVCETLAKKIARDGEGATKLVEVRVGGASNPEDAKFVAQSIANSPLVKTALFGNDPNWGRILMAAGKAGVPFDPHAVSVGIGPHCVFRNGMPTDADLGLVSESMKSEEVVIEVNLGLAPGGSAIVWTCDFSYDYVKINAEYTT
jgi:glutamate N-acetyltransferase/amino-acid N-acetyltransferase